RADCFQLGKTLDGGFYFFGGGIPLSREVWTKVEYSTNKTADELLRQLTLVGKIEILPVDFDVDTKEDLLRMARFNVSKEALLPEQKKIIAWSQDIAADLSGM